MKRICAVFFLIFLFLTVIHSGDLKIYFADTGQGDGQVIITPSGKAVVIDCNTGYGATILEILAINSITEIEYMFLTHYHSDHYGGLDDIIYGTGGYEGMDVKVGCYDRGGTGISSWNNAANSTTGKRKTVTVGEIFELGDDVTIQVTTANGDIYNDGGSADPADENAASVSLLIKYRKFHYWTGGDLVTAQEDLLGNVLGDIDVMKVSHHGSNTSTSEEFLSEITPEVAWIPVGDFNTYGHPTQNTLNKLCNAFAFTYQTETGAGGTLTAGCGKVAGENILCRTNGCTYTISFTGTYDEYDVDEPCSDDFTPPVFGGLQDISETGKGGEVILSWDAASDPSTPISYRIYQASTPTGFKFYNPKYSTKDLDFTVSGLSYGATYYFVVRAVDSNGNEETNNIIGSVYISSDTFPPSFAGLQDIFTSSYNELILVWNAASDFLPVSYNIYRSTFSMGYDFGTPLSSTEERNYKDADIIPGTRYYYVVRAEDSYGNEDANTVELSEVVTGSDEKTATVYPNPFLFAEHETLTAVTSFEISSADLFSVDGRRIVLDGEHFIITYNKVYIDPVLLGPGIYFLHLKSISGDSLVLKIALI